MDSKIILKLTFVHQVAAGARPPLFAIFEGLAMMLSPKVGELAFEVGVSTQALAQPAVGMLGRRRAPRERRLGARKGACWTSVVGARESPFPTLFCPLAVCIEFCVVIAPNLAGSPAAQICCSL